VALYDGLERSLVLHPFRLGVMPSTGMLGLASTYNWVHHIDESKNIGLLLCLSPFLNMDSGKNNVYKIHRSITWYFIGSSNLTL